MSTMDWSRDAFHAIFHMTMNNSSLPVDVHTTFSTNNCKLFCCGECEYGTTATFLVPWSCQLPAIPDTAVKARPAIYSSYRVNGCTKSKQDALLLLFVIVGSANEWPLRKNGDIMVFDNSKQHFATQLTTLACCEGKHPCSHQDKRRLYPIPRCCCIQKMRACEPSSDSTGREVMNSSDEEVPKASQSTPTRTIVDYEHDMFFASTPQEMVLVRHGSESSESTHTVYSSAGTTIAMLSVSRS